MADPISVLSTEYRRWPVSFLEAGQPVDPTGSPVTLAFKADDAAPVEADFKAAEWVTEGTAYYARILIGPGALVLTPDTYRVWLKITDNPEIPVLAVDTLAVVAGFAVSGGTYTNDPAGSANDRVRLLVGDTAAPFSLSDAEVAWVLTEAADDPLAAAAAAADSLATRYATAVDVSVGDVSKSFSQRAKQYADRATHLAAKVSAAASAEAAPIPWAGGLYRDDPASSDPNLVPLYFTEGMGLPAPFDDRACR